MLKLRQVQGAWQNGILMVIIKRLCRKGFKAHSCIILWQLLRELPLPGFARIEFHPLVIDAVLSFWTTLNQVVDGWMRNPKKSAPHESGLGISFPVAALMALSSSS